MPLDVASVKTACDTFLDEVKATKALATYGAYRADLEWFRVNLERNMVGKVTRENLIKVFGKGRAQELGQATTGRGGREESADP